MTTVNAEAAETARSITGFTDHTLEILALGADASYFRSPKPVLFAVVQGFSLAVITANLKVCTTSAAQTPRAFFVG